MCHPPLICPSLWPVPHRSHPLWLVNPLDVTASPLVHTECIAVQRSTKTGKFSIVCTVLHSTASAALCVNTLLGNNYFHLLYCVMQTLRYVTCCITCPVWMGGGGVSEVYTWSFWPYLWFMYLLIPLGWGKIGTRGLCFLFPNNNTKTEQVSR